MSAMRARKHCYFSSNKQAPGSWFLNTILHYSMKQWLITELGQKTYKRDLECSYVPESKGVLKERWGLVKRTQEPT